MSCTRVLLVHSPLCGALAGWGVARWRELSRWVESKLWREALKVEEMHTAKQGCQRPIAAARRGAESWDEASRYKRMSGGERGGREVVVLVECQ